MAARVEGRHDVVRIGCFGSFARGDWGVGSDLDLVVVVDGSAEPFERRAASWDTADLPVPADVLVYTDAEWRALSGQSPCRQPLTRETQWLYVRQEGGLRL